MEKTKGAESLRKALGLLDIVKTAASGMDMSGLVKESGLARPTAYRMVAALVEEGFLAQDASGRTVKLGPKLLELAQTVWSDGDLRSAAMVELERLVMGRSGARAQLFVRSGQQMTCIEEALGNGRSGHQIGQSCPVLESAAGRAVIAFGAWGQIDEELQALLPGTPTVNLSVLKTELGVARSRFYAMYGDEAAGQMAVSAPVFDFTGKPVAALVLELPYAADDTMSKHSAGASVLQAARSVSRARGGYPFGLDVPGSHSPSLNPETKVLAQATCLIGDSPVLDPRSGTIAFIDILGPSVMRLSKGQTSATRVALDEVAGALVELRDHQLLLAQQTKLSLVDSDGGISYLRSVSGLPSGYRYNDGVCDSEDRVWLGVMDMAASRGVGMLHCYETLDSDPRVLPGFSLPNGMAFSSDGKRLFVIDSMEKALFVFDYDPKIGTAKLDRQIALLPESVGRPSGLTLSSDGTLFTCHWDGGEVLALNMAGETLRSYPLPVPRPSGIAIDEQAKRLIVTTARARLSESDLERFPLSGALFEIGI